MKRELALQLLRKILPESIWDEDRFQKIFTELGTLAELKYDRYEMFQPGRLFFENLYAWLLKFEESERSVALEFVRNNLIFISREEFEQLTQIIYHDRIRQSQFDRVSAITGVPRFKVSRLAEHEIMTRVQRTSLFVAMSDGARIDYFRRQNLEVTNEQVLPSYAPSDSKINDVLQELEKDRGAGAKFECLYLIDDFSASGRTLLREIVSQDIATSADIEIPNSLKSRIKGSLPFDTTHPVGDYTFRRVPSYSKIADLEIHQLKYPTSGAEKDLNVIFPIQRLQELVRDRFVLELTENFFSFIGYNMDAERLEATLAEDIADAVEAEKPDVVLLAPA